MTFFNEIKLHQARVKAWQQANVRRWYAEKGATQDYTDPGLILYAAYVATPLTYSQVIGYFGLN